MPARGTGVRGPPPSPRRTHSTCTSHGKSAPHPLLLGTATPAAPRKTRPRSPTLDAAHEVIRTLELRGYPPQEDAGRDSDLEEIPEPSTGSTPAEPAPPAGSVATLCPAWKRGHCTGEGWCPKQHPQPCPDNGALPEVRRAAARAALHYGVAQGWILDGTAGGSVNIQEAVDRVIHAGQAAVALHTRGRHGGPAEGIIVEPPGMVLVLAPDMVRGVLHASRVRRARPQWTIQVYTPPRAWPSSMWAVLAVVWHLAPEDAPTGTAEEIARDLHTWQAGQDYPWRRPLGRPPSSTRGRGAQPRGNPPTAPQQEGTPLPADGHGPGRPARLRVAMERRGGATAAGPLGPPAVVFAHGHPGPRHSSHQGGFPAAAPPRRGPAPQPAGGGGLGTVEGRGRAPEPLFPPGPGQGATPRRGHGDRGMGGDRARQGVQVDHCGRPTAHAIAAGVPPPHKGGPLLGPPNTPLRGTYGGPY